MNDRMQVRTFAGVRSLVRHFLFVILVLGCRAGSTFAQTLPAPDDSRHSMLREAMLGVLPPDSPLVSIDAARERCLSLPVAPPNDRLEGPHGDSMLSAECKVIDYSSLPAIADSTWAMARYQWVSTFTAEDAKRGPLARDTVKEEEVVLLEGAEGGQMRPVWHARFEQGPYAILRSITPSVAPTGDAGVLLSVQNCVNGTGGCAQEFLQRLQGGAWRPIWQTWYEELPNGGKDRIWHGAQIDPRTLRGDAGFYQPKDANCCPSERLDVQLGLQGDHLFLKSWQVKPEEQH